MGTSLKLSKIEFQPLFTDIFQGLLDLGGFRSKRGSETRETELGPLSVSTVCTACMKGVWVCVRVFREAGYEREAGNVQCR